MMTGIKVSDVLTTLRIIRFVWDQLVKLGSYNGGFPDDLSIYERRRGGSRGVAYRMLPDPNPHQRRKTDYDSGKICIKLLDPLIT